MPRLLIIGDDGVERAVELTERTIQIGRGPGNDVVLPDAHKGVSRTHAELRFRNGRCVLVDLQSQNGTFLNGQRIEHAEVPFGADIGVGSYRLRIERTGIAVGEDESAIQPPPSTVGFGDREVEKTGFHDLRIIRPPAAAEDHDLTPVPAAPPKSSSSIAVIAGSLIVVVLAAATWFLLGRSGAEPAEPNLPMPDVASAAAAAPEPSTPAPIPVSPITDIPPASTAAAPASPAPATTAAAPGAGRSGERQPTVGESAPRGAACGTQTR